MKSYSYTLKYLYSRLPMFQRIGAVAYKANLDNTLALDKILDHPHKHYLTIHAAGTNGKGSTSHFLASVLQTYGLKTGLYTSPHLKDFRERIKVNGKMVSKSFVSEFVHRYRETFDQIQPSFFEMTFALATQYFKEKNVDIAVIEAGMGGRLDSTNIINPLLSIITNIGHDHMVFLGDTLEKIAKEKAGIIKPGVPLIIGESNPETDHIFSEKAKEAKTVISFAGKSYVPENIRYLSKTLKSDLISTDGGKIQDICSPLTGLYQLKNIATVFQVVDVLNNYSGFSISTNHLKRGISNVVKNTGILGRWQILSDNPLTICDIGHNKEGINEVLRMIGMIKYNKLHFVLGMLNDKDVEAVLKMLPPDAAYYFCKPDIPRGMCQNNLFNLASSAGLRGKIYNSVNEALESAKKSAGKDDLIFIGGSTFVVAEVV